MRTIWRDTGLSHAHVAGLSRYRIAEESTIEDLSRADYKKTITLIDRLFIATLTEASLRGRGSGEASQ